eukprot:5376942-Karenia_brevis.AAC.1
MNMKFRSAVRDTSQLQVISNVSRSSGDSETMLGDKLIRPNKLIISDISPRNARASRMRQLAGAHIS